MRFEFIPARSLPEAGSRIFSLSGQPPATTRGPKRALVALARSLMLDVDLEATNAVLGKQIAVALGVEWPGEAGTRTNQITLLGMNHLLAAAADRFSNESVEHVEAVVPDALDGWAGFRPAQSKLEAVNRISALTRSGPQELGPGGKERKSVFTNLAEALFPQMDTSVSKTDLGRALASSFGLSWTDAATSTGYTITLDGLNTVLAGAERYLDRLGLSPSATFHSAEEEGTALVAALRAGLPSHWDGRACVQEMRREEFAGWRQSEWPGWYAEFKGFPVLNEAFPMPETGGPRRRFGNTVFDYALGRVWDLKAHTETKRFVPGDTNAPGGTVIILNDAEAALECIGSQGLGFLIISGRSIFDDDGAFDDWHRDFTKTGRQSALRSNTGRRRARKRAFEPLHADAYWIANKEAFDSGVVAGGLAVRSQGRQQARGDQHEGAARRDKLHLVKTKADQIRVGSSAWEGARPA
ncbi:hypothetical protein [Cellulosimicrobium sp. SH8]|uniref:hypothetical protein n=1 Tax=Cellulosimicrobium sp. SH8 TaxID=2952936 RepID=UPI0021F28FA2|nr:hypothetical protein [Cellulosimicrobium sp. SH8]